MKSHATKGSSSRQRTFTMILVPALTGATSILADKNLAWVAIVVVCTWQSIAMNTIIYISGLQTVPEDVYEAGALDGAKGWKKFSKLTFPLIMPFFTINMVLSVKNFLMVFDQILPLTNGGPAQSTESISFLIYNNGLSGGQFGFQCANAIIFFIVIVTILLILGLATIIFPLYMTVVIAFKDPSEMTNDLAGILSLPKTWSFANFAEAMKVTDFWHSLLNSFLITIATVVVSVLVHSLAGYAIGRNMRDKKIFKFSYYYIVSGMFMPFAILMMPLVKETAQLHLDNLFGVMLLYVVFYMPMNVLLYTGYLKNIPIALEEAARVDGAKTWTTYWRVIFPLMKPMHATDAQTLVVRLTDESLGFEAEVERTQYEQVRMQMGLQEDGFSYPLAPGEQVVAPEVILAYSDAGLEDLSHILHRCIREHVCRGPWRDQPRPILINDWEAFYMDFTGEDIIGLAERAADLGFDLLVLDDGWYGARSDDNAGLGDWTVNEDKLGMSLHDLVKRINGLGLSFGLWFEPEMVNEDSDSDAVAAHLLQVLGLYDVLDRLLTRYPELLIEGCAGGGGRFDAGMLYYTPQIWTSDDTDPIDRLAIQYGTSFCYPCSVMGAHVSVSPNEITHRVTPLATRGTVAMQGAGFGYELDLRVRRRSLCQTARAHTGCRLCRRGDGSEVRCGRVDGHGLPPAA